jgi:hypothetical protein
VLHPLSSPGAAGRGNASGCLCRSSRASACRLETRISPAEGPELCPDTQLASGGGAPGDEVLAYRVSGGYATKLTVAAADVFAKPTGLEHPTAANLLLAGTTAAEMLHVTGVTTGETVVVHGASGAVGVSVLQQARLLGARVIGTAGPGSFDTVRKFGGTPVLSGDGLESRLRELAPEGLAAALDAVGTDEAVDVSLSLVDDRDRIVTIAAMQRAKQEGIRLIGGSLPASAAFRDKAPRPPDRARRRGEADRSRRPHLPIGEGPGGAHLPTRRASWRKARAAGLTIEPQSPRGGTWSRPGSLDLRHATFEEAQLFSTSGPLGDPHAIQPRQGYQRITSDRQRRPAAAAPNELLLSVTAN